MSNTLKFGNGEWYGKEGTILAYNDENNNYKPLLFDFDRASSATRVNKDGLIETVGTDQPRVDYKDDSKGALLLEPSRTNLVTYSEDFSNAYWTTLASGENIVSNSVISPNGTLNADTLEGDGTSESVYVRNDVTLSTSVDYTFSIFAKKGTNDFLAISAEGYSGATNTLVIFDLNNGIVTSGTANIEDYGNGWFRCSYTISISTDGIGRFLIYNSYSDITRAFPTSSYANGQNIYIYGAQLEQGSYATSYIPTQGSVVTRVADVCNQTVPDGVINSSEGVWYYEFSTVDEILKITSITDGTALNYIILYSLNLGKMRAVVGVGGVVQFNYEAIVTTTNTNKFAISWNNGSYSYYVNGVNVHNDTGSSFSPNTLNKISFTNEAGIYPFEGNVKDVRIYNTALTDQELINLTKI